MPYRMRNPMVVVTKSPYQEDTGLPWKYTPENFKLWHSEVFLEAYKRDVPPMTIEERMGHLRTFGYELEVEEG